MGRVQSQKLTCLPWPKWLPGIQDLIPGTWAQLWWIVVFGKKSECPVHSGGWRMMMMMMMMAILCNLFINTLILSQFSHAMNNQTPQTGFYLGFIVLGRSRKWLKVTSFLGGLGEMNMHWDAIWCILRHNCEKCYCVCIDLITSGWFFRYSYLYTVMITTFLGESWAFWGGSFYPSNTVDSIPCQKSGGQRLVFLWLIEPKQQLVTKSIETWM